MKREEDEEERITLWFGNNKDKQKWLQVLIFVHPYYFQNTILSFILY